MGCPPNVIGLPKSHKSFNEDFCTITFKYFSESFFLARTDYFEAEKVFCDSWLKSWLPQDDIATKNRVNSEDGHSKLLVLNSEQSSNI